MTFRLAERLGMTRGELLRRMDSAELTKWAAYDRIVCPDSWHQTALICCVISNRLRDPKDPPAKVEDFLPERYRKGGGKKGDVARQMLHWARMCQAGKSNASK